MHSNSLWLSRKHFSIHVGGSEPDIDGIDVV